MWPTEPAGGVASQIIAVFELPSVMLANETGWTSDAVLPLVVDDARVGAVAHLADVGLREPQGD